MTTSVETTIAEARELTTVLAALRKETYDLARTRRRLWLIASRSGVTFDDLAKAMGLNRSFISAQVGRARVEAGSKDPLAAPIRGKYGGIKPAAE